MYKVIQMNNNNAHGYTNDERTRFPGLTQQKISPGGFVSVTYQ